MSPRACLFPSAKHWGCKHGPPWLARIFFFTMSSGAQTQVHIRSKAKTWPTTQPPQLWPNIHPVGKKGSRPYICPLRFLSHLMHECFAAQISLILSVPMISWPAWKQEIQNITPMLPAAGSHHFCFLVSILDAIDFLFGYFMVWQIYCPLLPNFCLLLPFWMLSHHSGIGNHT